MVLFNVCSLGRHQEFSDCKQPVVSGGIWYLHEDMHSKQKCLIRQTGYCISNDTVGCNQLTERGLSTAGLLTLFLINSTVPTTFIEWYHLLNMASYVWIPISCSYFPSDSHIRHIFFYTCLMLQEGPVCSHVPTNFILSYVIHSRD